MGAETPLFMKIKPLADYTGLPEKLIRKLVKSGKVEHFHSGRTIYVSVEAMKEICTNGAAL